MHDREPLLSAAEQWISDGDFIQTTDSEEAVRAYLSAVENYRQAGELAKSAEILNHKIGGLYYGRGLNQEAAKWWERALEVYLDLQDPAGIADVCNKLGVVHKLMAQYSTALEYYQKGLESTRLLSDKKVKVKLLNNLGLVYKLLGHPRRAIEKFTESLTLKRSAGDHVGVANTLNNLGNVYKSLEEHVKALEVLEESRSIFSHELKVHREDDTIRFGLAAVTHDIGNLHFQSGHLETALEYYKESLNFNRKNGKIISLFADYRDLGEIYIRLEKLESAGRFLHQAKEMAEKAGMEDCLFRAYQSLGRLELAKENLEKAFEYFKDAIDILESIRGHLLYESHQTGFMKGVLEIYISAISVLIRLRRREEAFNYLEMMKARALLDVLEGGFSEFEELLSEAEILKEKELLEKLEKLNSEIAGLRSFQQSEFSAFAEMREQARRELHTFEETLYVTHPDLKELRGRGEPLPFKKARNLMSRDELAVYYLMTDRKLLIFLLSRKELKIIERDLPAEKLKERVSALQNPSTLWDHQAAKQLYEDLITPILPFADHMNRLCIIPDGILNTLPFQALEEPRTGRYLIEDFAIYYVPSLSALKSVRSLGNYGTSSLLALGDPQFMEPEKSGPENRDKLMALTPLPATREEVSELGKVYEPRVKVLTGAEATKTNFKKYASQFGVLHFATHAFTDEVHPTFSAIALARENGEYGFLIAKEIIKMELNADLVVLSACKTATGKVVEGEGMLGLTRAFFSAGVPTIVASLWNVDDYSTRELMVQFHSRFRNRERPATALREAQLYLLRETQYQNPFFWAPFVLIGDSE
ncbi:MAG: CHAT domain-containing protein [FCB group bacterium]|nr:CHAT domain-containing protein [FCB group bacterium]